MSEVQRRIRRRAGIGLIPLPDSCGPVETTEETSAGKKAVKYCRNLRLAGYSDWSLATLAELGAIFDRNANAPGLAGSGKDNLLTYHVQGNLFLTGDEWSGERRYDDRGHPDGYAWYFDFNGGRPNDDPTGWPYPFVMMRALCVRGSEK